jgi:nucleoside 2-deoxyribosyltransferase
MQVKYRDFLVYLAGPISGLTYAGGQGWREYVAQALPQEIRAISPLRAKAQMLSRVGVIEDSYEDNPLTSTSGITTRDRQDCTRADAVLFNMLGATRVSVGTCMEFGWADAHRIPIILVMEKSGNVHDHPMVRGVTGFRVDNLDDALKILEAVLMPEGIGTPRELMPTVAQS